MSGRKRWRHLNGRSLRQELDQLRGAFAQQAKAFRELAEGGGLTLAFSADRMAAHGARIAADTYTSCSALIAEVLQNDELKPGNPGYELDAWNGISQIDVRIILQHLQDAQEALEIYLSDDERHEEEAALAKRQRCLDFWREMLKPIPGQHGFVDPRDEAFNENERFDLVRCQMTLPGAYRDEPTP